MTSRWKIPCGTGTHLCMNGGILHVPDEDIQIFYDAYITELETTKLYIVEQKTDIFKFFIDLDYVKPEKLSDEDVIQFCTIISESVSGRCCIAKARPRPVSGGIKSGIHIVFPDVMVSRVQALQLRTKIITSLGEGKWDEIFDVSVYGGSGLRMLWSNKKPTGDPYIPWKILGQGDLSNKPSSDILELFSIRTGLQSSVHHEMIECSDLENHIQKYFHGYHDLHIKKIQRTDHDSWFVQTDSKYCGSIRRAHKSNHIWFSIKSGNISQRCFDSECSEFRGLEHNLTQTIRDQLKNVVIMGSPPRPVYMDIFPNGAKHSIQEVRDDGSSFLGTGPRELETLLTQHPFVRTVGFETN